MTKDRFKLTKEDKERINRVMENLIEKNISLDIDEIDSFDFPQDEPFGLQVTCNDRVYCFVVKLSSKNKNLVCAGPGAHLRTRTLDNGEPLLPPFFDRWKWFEYFDESYIAYADPMIFHDDEMMVGWFVGIKEEWYLETLASIIEKLAKKQEIHNENIMFFGSSGGAHSSIVLGTLIRDSKVLVNHPQFFILNYYRMVIDQLFKTLSHSFEGMTRKEIIKEIKPRLDVIELFKREKYMPPITYYLNVTSKVDIEKQALPFFKKLSEIEEKNYFNIVHYRQKRENPHFPLFTMGHINIIYVFCEKNLYNPHPDKEYLDEKETLTDLRRERDILKKQFRKIIHSPYWKITAPLRKSKQLYNSIFSKKGND